MKRSERLKEFWSYHSRLFAIAFGTILFVVNLFEPVNRWIVGGFMLVLVAFQIKEYVT